jgi:outer membrane murein-binding lipoprotein Lpp
MQSGYAVVAVVSSLLLLSACTSRESTEERHHDANTPAGKAGQAAHKVAVEMDKAGRVIGRKLDKAAHDAREGWDEAAQKDKDKKR